MSRLAIAFSACSLIGCSVDTFLSGDGGDPGDAQAEGGDAVAIDAGTGDVVSIDVASSGDGSDGSDGGSATHRRVFITSGDYSANFGGLSGADAACNSVAAGAGLGGTWAAWLSSSAASAASRLTHAIGPYELLDGTVVALDWAALTSGTLANAIDRDEHDALVPYNATTAPFSGVAWTGTAPDGSWLTGCNSPSGCTCSDWTEGSNVYAGSFGLDSMTNSSWTEENYAYVCGQQYSLYCFEQ
jgi:hypothetical protein